MNFEKINSFRIWLEKVYKLDLQIDINKSYSVVLFNKKIIFKIAENDIFYCGKKYSTIDSYKNNETNFLKLFNQTTKKFVRG